MGDSQPMIRGQVLLTGGPTEWKRGFKKNARGSLRIGVLVWHRTTRQKHFRSGAQAAYDYDRRGALYLKRKLKTRGHSLPLVWSGRTRQLSALPPKVTGTHKSAKLRMNVPGYVHMVPKRRNAPSLGAELTRITVAEVRRAANDHAKRLALTMNRAKTRRTER